MPFDLLPQKTVLEMDHAERTALARQIIAELPPEAVNLEAWVWSPFEGYKETWDPEEGCGTLACAMGHLTAHPLFRAAGLHFDLETRSPEIDGVGGYAAVQHLFGPFAHCFEQRRSGEPPLNDHALFLQRCDRVL